MIEYKGQHTTAKVMIDKVDSTTTQQIYQMISHEAFTEPVAIMPDCHAGKGVVIGFTMPMTDKIIPNVVGVDIGCGMSMVRVDRKFIDKMDIADLDMKIREKIPFGTNAHRNGVFNAKNDLFFSSVTRRISEFTSKYNEKFGTNHISKPLTYYHMIEICSLIGMEAKRAFNSLGTLGGGNHFIELGLSSETGDLCITVHSGSRHFGLRIANYWQKKAGKGALAYLTGDKMYGYLKDMVLAQMYAAKNRSLMLGLIMDVMGITSKEVKKYITSVHNYIDFNDFIIRKGAIASYEGLEMIIPFNMEDGLLICEGKSNPEWNFSAPHGAGRLGSRKWAKENLSIDEARQDMKDKGVYSSFIPKDEVRKAYKDPKIIEESIEPTAKIIDRVKPILNLKDK